MAFVTPNLTQDWRIWDNKETVNLITERGTHDYAQAPITAKRRALTFRELASSGGAYTAGDLVWLVPRELMPEGVSPAISDRVEDTLGDVWTILEVGLNTWRTWYRLVTRNLVLSADLQEKVTLYQPDAAQDQAGVRMPGYTAAVENVPASIQEIEATAEESLGKRQAVRRFTCWVGQRVRPAANWRVIDESDQIYQITGWRAADRFDVLQELDLEIVQ